MDCDQSRGAFDVFDHVWKIQQSLKHAAHLVVDEFKLVEMRRRPNEFGAIVRMKTSCWLHVCN